MSMIFGFGIVNSLIIIGVCFALAIVLDRICEDLPERTMQSDDDITTEQSMEWMAREHSREFAVLYARTMDPNTDHEP